MQVRQVESHYSQILSFKLAIYILGQESKHSEFNKSLPVLHDVQPLD